MRLKRIGIRDQVRMLPAYIENWIGDEHAARFIREFGDGFDLSELGFSLSSLRHLFASNKSHQITSRSE